jgi:hypothetical protein
MFNIRGKAIDSSRGDRENSAIHMWSKHNGANQRWRIVYVARGKKGKKIVSKGGQYSYNRSYGLYVNRPFNIVTRMRSGRILTVANNRILLKTKNNQSNQVFMLNSRTLRLESQLRKGWSLAMVANGNGNRRPTGLTLQRSNSKGWW